MRCHDGCERYYVFENLLPGATRCRFQAPAGFEQQPDAGLTALDSGAGLGAEAGTERMTVTQFGLVLV